MAGVYAQRRGIVLPRHSLLAERTVEDMKRVAVQLEDAGACPVKCALRRCWAVSEMRDTNALADEPV